MTNHKFTVRYDGREFFGWQRHAGKPTIQGAIEDALARVQGGPCVVYGAGRTDRGAHAEGQVFNTDVRADYDPLAIREALNLALRPAIEILSVASVSAEFHARTSARAKTYRYELWNASECPPELHGRTWHVLGTLDTAAMRSACTQFIGARDFASFGTRPNFQRKSTRRDLCKVDLSADGPKLTLVLEADGFLYKMVRNIVRAIVKVGEGRIDPAEIPAMLDARDRAASPGTAPASGLYLDAVHYG